MKIANIVTHTRAHQDELLAIWLARVYGQTKFQDVQYSKIVFLEKELERTYPDDLYIGIGFGRFDEHRQNGRLPNTCAAMLVAEYLGITKVTGLTELLTEALWCDTRNGIKETRLANLIKTKHRVKKGADQFGTYRYAADAFNAIVDGAKDSTFDLRVVWNRHVDDLKISTKTPAWVTVNRFVNESFMRRNDHVTELAYIACRMDEETRQLWLADTFSMLMMDATQYAYLIESLKKSNPLTDIQTERSIEPAVLIESDSELLNKAVNAISSGKPAVLVVRRSSGNIQVFADSERGIDLSDLAAMVRMAEYKKRTGKFFSFESALGEGTKKQCKVWHQPNPNTLLNGSLSHPGVKPSVLTLSEMEDIVTHAFTAAGRQMWIDRYFNNEDGTVSFFSVAENLEDLLRTA